MASAIPIESSVKQLPSVIDYRARPFSQAACRQRDIGGNHDVTRLDALDDVVVGLVQPFGNDDLLDERMPPARASSDCRSP